jgi:hypothetical protein
VRYFTQARSVIAVDFITSTSCSDSVIISTFAVIPERVFSVKSGSLSMNFTSYETIPELWRGVVSIELISAFTSFVGYASNVMRAACHNSTVMISI